MRLLHVTPFYEPFWGYGGMVRSSSALCRALARAGHEVTVATTQLAPSAPLDETLGGVRVRRFRGPALLSRLLVPWPQGVRRFVAAALPRTDVVHLHGFRNGLSVAAAGAALAAARGYVLTTHGGYPHHGQHVLAKRVFDRVFGARVVRQAEVAIAVSDAEARELPRPARVVPNGVGPCGAARRERPKGARGKRLLFVGSDRPQKRARLLPALLAAVPDAELAIVGPFAARSLHSFDGLHGRVKALGVLAGEALAEAYASADLLVHPAVGEAFGLVPFEAALAGTAAVVAGGHGCGEWFARAGGCVVPPDDQAALAQAVRVRLDAPEQAEDEARAVAQFARERLTWERAVSETERVYAEVVDARAARAPGGRRATAADGAP